jgi:hypothetical protein
LGAFLHRPGRYRAARAFDRQRGGDVNTRPGKRPIVFLRAAAIFGTTPTIPPHSNEAFTALEARRLVERFEWHYTPKHGSWLNMAESELAILSNQCLDRRIPGRRSLERHVDA